MAAANAGRNDLLLAGVAGLVAGAMSAFWGALAMGLTAVLGRLFGTVV